MWAYLYHKLKWIPPPSARIGWHYIQVTAYKSQCPFCSFRGVVNDQVASALHKTITRKNKKERCSSLNKTVRTHFTTSLLNLFQICMRRVVQETCYCMWICSYSHDQPDMFNREYSTILLSVGLQQGKKVLYSPDCVEPEIKENTF